MKKLPESISQEIDLLKQNTLEKFRLPAGSLDDVFSLFMQSQAEVLRLKEELTLMRIQLFGKRSEKQATNEDDPQMRMFDEAEHAVTTATDEEQQADAEQESVLPETVVTADQPKAPAARGKRKPLPADLPNRSNSCCPRTANRRFTADYDSAENRQGKDGVYGALTLQ